MHIRKSFIVIFLSLGMTLSGKTYFIATNGNDENPGTITQPFGSWQKGFSVLAAGDTLFIRGGIYRAGGILNKETYYGTRITGKNGSRSDWIRVEAYPDEIPVFDCTDITGDGDHVGVSLEYCSYWHLKGLWIKNVKEHTGHYGTTAALGDCLNMVWDRCTFSDSGNGVVSYYGDSISYINCDSFNHEDRINNGNLANGFGGNVKTGGHVSLIGCRAWHCSDDGFDFYNSNGYISWLNCWSFDNGYGKEGNGAGFKSGASYGAREPGVQRRLVRCLATGNSGIGFDESQDNYTAIVHNVINCTSYRNKTGYNFMYGGQACDTLRNNIEFDDRNRGTINRENISDHNTWDFYFFRATVSDFISLDEKEIYKARKMNGDLPDILFLHLARESDLIDAGTDVGLPYTGDAPDVGAFESDFKRTYSSSSKFGLWLQLLLFIR